MKYYKQRPLQILLFCVLIGMGMGCSSEEFPKKPKEKPTIKVPTQRFDLYAVNGVISLPTSYERVDFEQSRKSIRKSPLSAFEKTRSTERINYIQRTYPAYNLFFDKENPLNSFVVLPSSEYIPINEDVGNVLVMKVERNFNELFKYKDMTVKRTQARKSSSGSREYVKLKYLLSKDKTQVYATCYFFSNNGKTFSIWIEQQKDEDFEEYIETLVVAD